MSSVFCECGSGLQNLGTTACPRVLKTIKKHIFVPLTDSTGARNSILTTDFVDGVLPDSYIAGKLSEDDGTKKWYPTPNTYEFVEQSRTDNTTEEAPSGLTLLIQTGVSTFQADLLQVDEQLASKIQSTGCTDFGVYEIDDAGSIRGEESADGTELYPIAINKGSLQSYSVPPVEGSSVQRVRVMFQYDNTVNEGDLRIISAGSIETNMKQLRGFIDGTLVGLDSPAPTATSFSATFEVKCYGYFGETIWIEGQTEPTDWTIIDSSLNVIVPSGITEGIAGQYDFTIPSTPSDTLTVSFTGALAAGTDQGYDSNTIEITTP